jgi:hypothetical protein
MRGIYHGFFSQWEQPHDWGFWKVIHYTSTDLKNWEFQQYVRNSTCPPNAPSTANCSVAYDSAVFRVGDGRFALFSAGPSPGFTGPHPPVLCTRDPHLLQWEECDDSLQLYTQLPSMQKSHGVEGLHVIDRNASVTYDGYSWMNWEGRGPVCDRNSRKCKPGTPNLARSNDSGISWEASPTNLWGDEYGIRPFDAGLTAYQGPLLLQPNNELYALYFTAVSVNNGVKFPNALPGCAAVPFCEGVSDSRSMLQLARVRTNKSTGWLHANRSEPFALLLKPPLNAPAPTRVLPVDSASLLNMLPKVVWAVARVEAAAIALAEIDRWAPFAYGSFPKGDKLSTAVLAGYKLAEASYRATPQPTVGGCVAACDADSNCSALTFCAGRNTLRYCTCGAGSASPAALSAVQDQDHDQHQDQDQHQDLALAAAGTPTLAPAPAGGCCFMMSKPTDIATGGPCRMSASSNCGAPDSAACRGWSSASKLGLRVRANSSVPIDYRGDEYQRWRNPQFSESYFQSITMSGTGRSATYLLRHVRNDTCGRCGGRPLNFELTVVANGTITELLFGGAPLVPLQWRGHT